MFGRTIRSRTEKRNPYYQCLHETSFHPRILLRKHNDEARVISKPMTARLVGDELELRVLQTVVEQDAEEAILLRGKRMPPMPPRPDLNRVNFGEPIQLFNGRDLTGWRLSNPKKKSGWRVMDGVLTNSTPKTDFSAYGDHGNLRTNQECEDFQLSIEYNVPSGGNSGIYLRGMYEVRVVDRDSKMQGINGPGAVFGRITPSTNAGKPGGEWNRYELTLVDRHITVVLRSRAEIRPAFGPSVSGDACVALGRQSCALQRQRGASPAANPPTKMPV